MANKKTAFLILVFGILAAVAITHQIHQGKSFPDITAEEWERHPIGIRAQYYGWEECFLLKQKGLEIWIFYGWNTDTGGNKMAILASFGKFGNQRIKVYSDGGRIIEHKGDVSKILGILDKIVKSKAFDNLPAYIQEEIRKIQKIKINKN